MRTLVAHSRAALVPGSCLLLATVLAAGDTLRAQNLVTNGDFQSASTTPWTFSGYTVAPQVMNFDTTGTGVSLNFSNRPGSKQGTLPPGGRFSMLQNVQIVGNAPHLLVADVAVANTKSLTNIDAGDMEFHVDGVLLKKVKFGHIYPDERLRRQVCIRFTPTATGSKVLEIVFARAWGADLITPRHHIDNIVLLRLPAMPLVCAREERKIGGNLTLDLYGAPGNPFGLFVSPGLTTGVPLPGFAGTWWLAQPSLSVLFQQFDTNGEFRFVQALTQANAGAVSRVPLHWQAIELRSGRLHLGTLASFGVYP